MNFKKCYGFTEIKNPIIYRSIFTIVLIILMSSCARNRKKELLRYSTNSDSALFFYKKGWEQIMDYGDYSAAEASYRKALASDPNFLVGKSVLARLTPNLEERLAFYKTLLEEKHTVKGDERLVLDVYIALTYYTNVRDQQLPEAKEALQKALILNEKNFGKIVRRYPEETYLKSEYIEVLHALYGARAALDSLTILTTESQKSNPFLLGYKAILTAELENYHEALGYAEELKEILKGKHVARPDAILADIYVKMKDYKTAKIHADKAVKIDPKNVDAGRLKKKIDSALSY
ncbi:MAG TPA: hypothetical protein ENK46_12050 [Flavobacteriia bacterium]|nr:hypothetical protein [Flavobacteriia bacterium]